MMVARYSIPVPPPALGRSKVSHKLQLSPQEKFRLRFTIFAFFFACSTSLFLLVDVVSSPEGSSTLRDESHNRGVISAFDKPPSIAKAPLSSYWAYYSPYHPAGKFKGSTPKRCVVSQVNIVSFFFLSRVDRSRCRSAPSVILMSSPAASTPRCPIPNFRSDRGNSNGPRQASSCH